ncbi:MAG: hypothetical protein ACYDEJ_10000 [Desulfitobacteriaceae bacterium]
MRWLWGVWICFGLLVWRFVGYWEWSIPLDWQKLLASMVEKNRLGELTYECHWQVNLENPMAEWYVWRFLQIIPKIDSKLYANCYIELGTDLKDSLCRDTYLACLQRRFPDIEIKLKLENLQS